MHIEVRPSQHDQFTWTFVAADGQTSTNKEIFPTRNAAISAAKSCVLSVALMFGFAREDVAFVARKDGQTTSITFGAQWVTNHDAAAASNSPQPHGPPRATRHAINRSNRP